MNDLQCCDNEDPKSELKGLRSMLDIIIPSMKLNPSIFDDFDPLPLDLIIEIEEAERKKKESRKAYYKIVICWFFLTRPTVRSKRQTVGVVYR